MIVLRLEFVAMIVRPCTLYMGGLSAMPIDATTVGIDDTSIAKCSSTSKMHLRVLLYMAQTLILYVLLYAFAMERR